MLHLDVLQLGVDAQVVLLVGVMETPLQLQGVLVQSLFLPDDAAATLLVLVVLRH